MNIWVRPSRASRSVVCDPSSRPPLCPLVANSRPCRWGARWQMRPAPLVSYTLSQWLWHRQFYLVVCRGQCIRRPLCTTTRSHRDTCQSQCPTWQHLLPQQVSSDWAAATIDTTCTWHLWRTVLFVRLSPFKFKRWNIKVYLDFGIHQGNRVDFPFSVLQWFFRFWSAKVILQSFQTVQGPWSFLNISWPFLVLISVPKHSASARKPSCKRSGYAEQLVTNSREKYLQGTFKNHCNYCFNLNMEINWRF